MVKRTPADLTFQLDQVLSIQSPNGSAFPKVIDSEIRQLSLPINADTDTNDEKDCILSQDFFCTPDYITPEMPYAASSLDWNEERFPCPKSPEKIKTCWRKRQKLDVVNLDESCESMSDPVEDVLGVDEVKIEKPVDTQKKCSYVSKSAIALRCRVMPPPCLMNPYLSGTPDCNIDHFGFQRLKNGGFYPKPVGGDGLSRYLTDFHEIEKLGTGNFNHVFKVFKRIDGCCYAVKRSIKQLHQDIDRRKALNEVQALAALGYHDNIVGYYSSWLENEQLFIQLELCDHSLSVSKQPKLMTEAEALDVTYQMAKALEFLHSRGIAHLDLKPDNIYVKKGVYKLGDFGCATLMDKSLPVEEGDARYMPQEIMNENYDHLDKVDIFSLGASIYEIARGLPLPDSGSHFLNLKQGKLPLLPSHSLQFQNLIKAMLDANPVRRPSAKEILENPVFCRIRDL